MKVFASGRSRWYLLAACWVALIVLGVGGFREQSESADLGRSKLDNLYLTVQLATLEYDGGDEAVNWRLQIARFVAPVMAAGTVLQTASVVFRDQYTRWRLRFLKGHTIVCGLGAAGTRLAVALTQDGQPVVGIEALEGSPGLATAREHEIPTLVGDATDPAVLQAARVDRAARVVVLCATDAVNVGVTATLQSVERDRRRPALRASVHLTDAELTELLRGVELGGDRSVRVEFFNLHERAARALLAEHTAFGDGHRPPHVMVFGLGQLGRSLTVAATQQWVEHGEGPLRLTLVDREAVGRWHAMLLQHPALDEATQATCLELDLESPSGEAVAELTRILDERPPTLAAVVYDDESLALSSALFVHKALRDPAVPVVVRTDADAGLGSIIQPSAPGAEAPFPGMALFPFLDRACTPSLVEGGVREQLARGIHEDHTARAGTGAQLHRPWDELSDDERESSRRAADGIVDSLATLGYELVPLARWGASEVPFSEHEVEHLAAQEHLRWKDEREAAGWTYGAVRDDAARHNPLLVDWDELPEPSREQNRAGIRQLPAMLARAGFAVAATTTPAG